MTSLPALVPLSPAFEKLRAGRMTWIPELGIGYYPVTAAPYDGAYWDKYRAMDHTRIGDKLTAARLALVRYYAGSIEPAKMVDIGIGGGRFAEEMCCKGFDVNPEAVAWLASQGRLADPYAAPFEVATFWDSLEHIHDPTPLLANVRRFAFVSCPIFDGPTHARRSKHFRPDEHCFYFTQRGLQTFMDAHGFELVVSNTMEQSAGREDIGTFVFRRAR